MPYIIAIDYIPYSNKKIEDAINEIFAILKKDYGINAYRYDNKRVIFKKKLNDKRNIKEIFSTIKKFINTKMDFELIEYVYRFEETKEKIIKEIKKEIIHEEKCEDIFFPCHFVFKYDTYSIIYWFFDGMIKCLDSSGNADIKINQFISNLKTILKNIREEEPVKIPSNIRLIQKDFLESLKVFQVYALIGDDILSNIKKYIQSDLFYYFSLDNSLYFIVELVEKLPFTEILRIPLSPTSFILLSRKEKIGEIHLGSLIDYVAFLHYSNRYPPDFYKNGIRKISNDINKLNRKLSEIEKEIVLKNYRKLLTKLILNKYIDDITSINNKKIVLHKQIKILMRTLKRRCKNYEEIEYKGWASMLPEEAFLYKRDDNDGIEKIFSPFKEFKRILQQEKKYHENLIEELDNLNDQISETDTKLGVLEEKIKNKKDVLFSFILFFVCVIFALFLLGFDAWQSLIIALLIEMLKRYFSKIMY